MKTGQAFAELPGGARKFGDRTMAIINASPDWLELLPNEGRTVEQARLLISRNAWYVREKAGYRIQTRIVDGRLFARATRVEASGE
jgi:hypothetical protein